MKDKAGIILLGYGSPENLDDLGAFLSHIRGSPVPPDAVASYRRRYEESGGPSPFNRLTREQAKRLAEKLEKRGHALPVAVGMAHCAPFIEDAVKEAERRGLKHLVGFPMAPHFSSLSSGKYHRFFREAAKRHFSGTVSVIDYFFDEPGLVDFFSNEVIEKRKTLGPDTHVLFTAHSLPEATIRNGDPYVDQFTQNARLIAATAQLSPPEYSLAYQSKSRAKEPWLGPSVEEALSALRSDRQIEKILLSPIGFVCDHTEILYDLDLQAKKHAESLGVTLARTASPNTDDRFIEALANRLEKQWS